MWLGPRRITNPTNIGIPGAIKWLAILMGSTCLLLTLAASPNSAVHNADGSVTYPSIQTALKFAYFFFAAALFIWFFWERNSE